LEKYWAKNFSLEKARKIFGGKSFLKNKKKYFFIYTYFSNCSILLEFLRGLVIGWRMGYTERENAFIFGGCDGYGTVRAVREGYA
jgi:hypothetical protein